MSHALVNVALTPVRREASVRAEQISQELMGSVLEIIERQEEWVLIKGEDSYEGWVNLGALHLCGADEARAWRAAEGGVSAVVLEATIVDEDWEPLVALPWGARVRLEGEVARLPDGRSGRLVGGQWVEEREAAERFPAAGPPVVATAREWMGVPYVWGGRTRWGADCSGFVQALYRLHGAKLPRDSDQQAEAGERLEFGTGFAELRAGDLVFFHARDSERIVHVAFSLGGSLILHAAEGNGQVKADDLAGDSELERSLAGRVAIVRRIFA
jgi:cell wall-associated NlpC family hydrolase